MSIESAFADEMEKVALSRELVRRAKDLAHQDARALGTAEPIGGETFKTLEAALARRRRQGHVFAGTENKYPDRATPASARDAARSTRVARDYLLYPPRLPLKAGPVKNEGAYMARMEDTLSGIIEKTRKVGASIPSRKVLPFRPK